MTNSHEAIAAVLNEDGDRDTTVTQAETANQASASTQPTNLRQLNPSCNYLRNLNVDNDVVMKGWPEEIPDRSVSGLSVDRSHIKCDVCNTGRSLGIINMTHPYTIGAWKTHIGTAGHKEGIIAREEQKRREALGDSIKNDGEHQQLVLDSFFTVKGTGSRFSQQLLKTKKRRKTETEKSSRNSMEVTEVVVNAVAAGDATEL